MEEEPDWDPDEVQVVKSEWKPGVLEKLNAAENFSQYKLAREFLFVHLFSGPKDHLKEALLAEAAKEGLRIKVESYDKEAQDGADLTADKPYVDLVANSDSIDGYHAGFPCGSFSRVRHREGGPPPVRDRSAPYGRAENNAAQQQEADRGTVLAVRSSILAAEVLDNQRKQRLGECATLENPPGSSNGPDLPAWELPEVAEFMDKFKGVVAEFNTCRYMDGKNRWWKPAKWGGRLQGLEELSGKCQCPSWVNHEALTGKSKTALAAAYPALLCEKYAKLVIRVFKQNLQLEWWRFAYQSKKSEVSKLQVKWMRSKEEKTPAPVTDKQHLVDSKWAWNAGDINQDVGPKVERPSKRTKREMQNEFALGGLRNPEYAVSKLFRVKEVGSDISRAWNHFIERHPEALDVARQYGGRDCQPNAEIAAVWEQHLRKLLKAKAFEDIVMKEEFEFTTPLNTELWAAWLRASGDPEKHVVDWARRGVPLGMDKQIETCGIFPEVVDEETSDEPAHDFGAIGDIVNYTSFYDLVDASASEIDRLVGKGFAVVRPKSWIIERLGKGTISRMALIQKVKEDGTTKNRIIVDMRRSGGNARCRVPERLVLPRVTDVIQGARRLWSWREELHRQAADERWSYEREEELDEWEVVGADLADAFCHYPVHADEVSNCVCPGVKKDEFVIFTALLFGFKAAPLLMARLSAMICRFIQSLMNRAEGALQCYMDDPIILLAGPKPRRDRTLAMILYSLFVMGVNVAYSKGERGLRVVWIGVVFELCLAEGMLRLTISQKMLQELQRVLQGMHHKGMVGLQELRSVTGRLSWVAGILPRCRWAVNILYSTIASVERDGLSGAEAARAVHRKDQRPKINMVPVVRFQLARVWFLHLLNKADDLLLRLEPLVDTPPELCIVTDASPHGVGAVLCMIQDGKLIPWVAMEAPVRAEDAEWLGVEFGEASSQGPLEAWAVLLAIRMWKTKLVGCAVLLKADSTVALAMAAKLSSRSPVVNWVGAELALRLELLQVRKLIGHHLPGAFNTTADWLSRPHERAAEVPNELKGVKIQKFDGDARRQSIIPPPGVARELWGKVATTTIQAYDSL